MTSIDLLVIQPTSLCNLDCVYCYVPDRQNAARLPLGLLERLLRAVAGSTLAAHQADLRILWHAGEPLAAGIDFYRSAIGVVDSVAGDRFQVRHSIQTNGTLITDEWCEFFRANRFSIGVSLDGPPDIHDAKRVTRGGSGSFAHAMRGIDLLRAHDLDVSVLCVLTDASIERPDDLFRFFADSGLDRVAFNVEEIEGPHLDSSLVPRDGGLARARSRYRAFMSRLASLNRDNGWPLTVREFVALGQRIDARRGTPASEPVVVEQHLGSILTMTRDGTLFSWSPELASGIPGAPNRFALGNVKDVESIDDLLATDHAVAIQAEIDRGVEMCRRQCDYFGVCGGGSPGNKFYEHGTAAVTQTVKCALQVQELTEVVIATFADPH